MSNSSFMSKSGFFAKISSVAFTILFMGGLLENIATPPSDQFN